nr:class I tRNA ligase family protein [Candidatus Paceibacterota bacterium]
DGEKLVRTPEVMDVWFDSGCMPYAQDHMLGTPTNFDPKPADYIAEGLDQTRGWFYTLHAVANMLHDNPSQAYKNVICMGLLMDANGQKMSKSRGNVVGPWEMFDKYGADTVRLWMYSVNQPGDSKNFDEKGLDEVNKKFFNTLRNVVSFYELYRDLGAEEKNFTMENLNVLDSWIIARLFMVTRDMTRWLDVYNITDAARALRDFVDDLSTWYVRRSRDRLKDGDAAAKQVFYFVLMRFSKLLAPFVPFTAEDVYQKLRHDGRDAESVHLALWPDYVEHENIDRVIESMKQVRRLVTLGLEARQKVNVKVRQPLQKLSIPKCELSDGHLEILKDELNIKEIVIDEKLAEGEVVLDTEITSELQREGYARELMRALQDMRKKAGLNPTDVIALSIETNDAGRAVIESFQSEIQKVVNVKELIFGQNEGEEITVDDLVFKVKM